MQSESLSARAERLLGKLYPVPFCFMGMGIFRVWTETLYANAQIEFPSLAFNMLPPLDGYAFFDYLSAAVLMLLALLAKKIAPLYTHSWVVFTTFASMIAATCLNFATIYHPELAPAFQWPAIITGSVGIAFILMLWSEFFACLNPLKIAGYYSAGIMVSLHYAMGLQRLPIAMALGRHLYYPHSVSMVPMALVLTTSPRCIPACVST